MSYTRGDYYTWRDDDRIHLWARDGYDEWDDAVWNDRRKKRASGVSYPQDIFDEIVVMRYDQLAMERRVTETQKRAIKKWKGNVGCEALLKKMLGRLRAEGLPF